MNQDQEASSADADAGAGGWGLGADPGDISSQATLRPFVEPPRRMGVEGGGGWTRERRVLHSRRYEGPCRMAAAALGVAVGRDEGSVCGVLRGGAGSACDCSCSRGRG